MNEIVVVKNAATGKYLSGGWRRSWVRDVRSATRFNSIAAAQHECRTESEQPVALDGLTIGLR